MTRAENWDLILQLCKEAQDDVVDSLRIELLNDFGKTEEFSRGPNLRHIASCVRSFLPGARRPILPSAAPHKPLIFCLAASGSNLLNLLPVAQEARRRDLLGGIVAGEAVQRVNPGAFDGFSPVVHERTLCGRVGIGFLPGSFQRAVRRLRWILQWLQKRDPHSARRVRQNYGSYLKLMVSGERARIAWRELFAEWQPSCIVTTSDFYPFEFQMIAQARKMGIPTAILQHGETNDVVIWPTYADTFLAWGDSYREQLIKRGAPKYRVKVTGMPAADVSFNRLTTKNSETAKNGKPVCLVLSHTQDRIEDSALFEEFGRCLAETIRTTPEIRWQIKLHPAEDDSFYRETGISQLERVEILTRDVSLDQAVSRSDVVCTIRSTAGLQAMMLQKPVLVLALAAAGGQPVTWPLQGGGVYIQDSSEFRNNLTRLISDEEFLSSILTKQRAFLDLRFAHRGRAAAALVDFLEEHTIVDKPPAEALILLTEGTRK